MRDGRTVRLIRVYQSSVSHRLPANCSFDLSCSRYAVEAYESRSWPAATLLVSMRVLRCAVHGLTHRRRRLPVRRLIAVASLSMMVVGWTAMLAPPASAEINGGCEASANGQNLKFNTADRPLKVKEHGSISIVAKAPDSTGIVSYALRYAGIPFATKSERFSEGVARTVVPVDRYATYGVGKYEVTVTVGSNAAIEVGVRECLGYIWVTVQGDPLDTTAGKAAAAGAVVGAVGLTASLFSGTRARVPEGWGETSNVNTEVADELEKASDVARREERYGPAPTAGEVLVKWPWEVCGFFIFSAIFLTLMVAATGEPKRRVRIRRKPRLSFVGIGSGLLLGISTFVLLQQYGVIFPTRNLGIIALVGGLFLGIFLPTYGRIRALRRAVRSSRW